LKGPDLTIGTCRELYNQILVPLGEAIKSSMVQVEEAARLPACPRRPAVACVARNALDWEGWSLPPAAGTVCPRCCPKEPARVSCARSPGAIGTIR
jgi:hypothetical protein